MVKSFLKLIAQAFPELMGGYHLTQKGVIVALSDYANTSAQLYHNEEIATDRYRPVYAAHVQRLTPDGKVNADRKILKNLPLPGYFRGEGTGTFAPPALGTHVRLALSRKLLQSPSYLSSRRTGNCPDHARHARRY